MANINVALGCEAKFKIAFTGTDPQDLTSPFDLGNYNLSCYLSYQGGNVALSVSAIDDLNIEVTVDQDIIGFGGEIPQQSYTMKSLPACPCNLYGVSKVDGKRYSLATFTIQFVPRF